jgi:glycosyltransferase involved in cell wall biosynthesis
VVRNGAALPGVGLVHWAFPPVVGGVESHLWDYARRLDGAGFKVTVFTGTEESRRPAPGVDVVRHHLLDLATYRGAATGRRARPSARLRAAVLGEFLWREVLRRGIGVLHGHNLHHFTPVVAHAVNGIAAARLAPGRRLARLHTLHSLWRTEADIAAAAPCLKWERQYAVSDFIARDCRAVLGVPAERTYLGIDREAFPRRPVEERVPGRIVLPARLIPDKGADVAVAALALLRRRAHALPPGVDPHLVLTRTAEALDFHDERRGYRDRLDELIDRHGLREHVQFVDRTVDQMAALYAESHVVAYPSVYPEPLGLAPLEALSAGRPVVVTATGGLAEGVRVLGGPCVVPPRDARALADALYELLDDDVMVKDVVTQGGALIERQFDLADYVARMREDYEGFGVVPDPGAEATAWSPLGLLAPGLCAAVASSLALRLTPAWTAALVLLWCGAVGAAAAVMPQATRAVRAAQAGRAARATRLWRRSRAGSTGFPKGVGDNPPVLGQSGDGDLAVVDADVERVPGHAQAAHTPRSPWRFRYWAHAQRVAPGVRAEAEKR